MNEPVRPRTCLPAATVADTRHKRFRASLSHTVASQGSPFLLMGPTNFLISPSLRLYTPARTPGGRGRNDHQLLLCLVYKEARSQSCASHKTNLRLWSQHLDIARAGMELAPKFIGTPAIAFQSQPSFGGYSLRWWARTVDAQLRAVVPCCLHAVTGAHVEDLARYVNLVQPVARGPGGRQSSGLAAQYFKSFRTGL